MPPSFSKRCWFTFPTRQQVEQPIIWQMSRKFPDVVFDIRQASVQNEIGIMAVLLTGPEAQVQAAIDFVRASGVTVEPIEKSVVEG
jgi:ABC-type methionine transport system ATPase subunit